MQHQPQPDDNPHNQVGNYLLGKTLGEGTFGKVKTATHLPTGQTVAVKIIVKSKITDVADVERVSRELHILRIVRHPSIIQLYEIIETQRYLFIITEHLEKGELFEHIVKHGHLSEQQSCTYFQQLISGLKYMKELRISHRDLKPQNLLLTDNNTLKIIDFGLSNTYEEEQMLRTACGSPCYAAPEMLAGKKYNGSSVDVWSCGIILFAMVCGYLPFEDPNTSQLYKKIMSRNIYFPSRVSSQFRDIVLRLLEVDPDKRCTIEQIGDHPWLKIAQNMHPVKGIKVGVHLITTDQAVLKEMQKIGFDIVHARISIEANRQGPDLAGYYLQMKKMKGSGYESEHDINSLHFNYSFPDPNAQESFQNTRKSYYFGVHDFSPLKKSKGKSAKKGKQSPSKSELQMQPKKRVKIQSLQFELSKLPKTSTKKNIKSKGNFKSAKKFTKRNLLKSLQLGESSIKKAYYQTASKRHEWLSSNKKRCPWREKKNKSCSLIERYS